MPAMPKNYKELYMQMMQHDLLQCDLAEIVGRSLTYVSLRFSGIQQWTLEDIYRISDYFEAATDGKVVMHKDLEKYFPHPDKLINTREMFSRLKVQS